MKTVPLYGKLAEGRVALVDDEDYDLVMQHRWTVWRDRRHPHSELRYAMTGIQRNGKSTTARMHQVITGWALTDHIDGDGLNNQRSNLRPATRQENARNTRSVPHSSQFKGVQWVADVQRWKARIRKEGVSYDLGYYRDETDAAKAYDAGARELFGEFARVNFPGIYETPERVTLYRKHPEVADATIVEMRAAGFHWREIAAKVGMSGTGVRMRWEVAVNGSRPDRPKPGDNRPAPQTRDPGRAVEAVRLLGAGMQPPEVAEVMGVHLATVYKWVRRIARIAEDSEAA